MSTSAPPSGSTSKLAFVGAVVGGKYRLEEVIGYGGMGSVWSATHLGLGERVALKLVSTQFAKSADARRRFEMEAKAAAKIRSRHVPQVFDNGVLDDGTPYLAMELLRGEPLVRRISQQGPMPLVEVVNVLDQCARALTRAHSLGIVHRDIKPDNIYLAQSVDDDAAVVKVLDFGIAKFTLLGEGEVGSSTRTGALLGTPSYMSPEQARGLRTIDHRTDLYSLGLVAYTMLTGKLAFNAESLGDLLLQICVNPLPSLRVSAPWLPPGVEDWFQKACAREPEARYSSAQALVEALRIAAGLSAPQVSENALVAAGGAGEGSLARGTPGGVPALPITTSAPFVGTSLPAGVPRGRSTVAALAIAGVVVLSIAGAVVAFVLHGRETVAASPTESATPASQPPAPSPASAAAAMSLAPIATAVAPGSASAPHIPVTSPSPSGKPAASSGRGSAQAASAAVGAKSPPPSAPAAKPQGTIDLGY